MMKSAMSKARLRIIAVAIIILLGLALQQGDSAAEIDVQKDVYLFLHGRTDLQEKAVNALVTYGFLKEKIILATPDKVGNVGDYMAMLWKPPEPDHIKIQRITKVEETEPEEIKGRWRGVSREDIDSIPLK
jgi:hypothetical protein